MKLHKITLFFTFLLSIQAVIGQLYIRHNNLGYLPKANKTIVILSEQNLENNGWKLIDKKSNKVIAEDNINSSITDQGIHTPFPYNYKVDISAVKQIGEYSFQLKDSATDIKIDTGLYTFVPLEILRYFRVQRSGAKDALDHKISHKGDKRSVIHRRVAEKNSEWKYTDPLPKKWICVEDGTMREIT